MKRILIFAGLKVGELVLLIPLWIGTTWFMNWLGVFRLFESFGETFLIILLLVCIIIESWFVVIVLEENWRWAGRLARGKKP